VPSTHSEAVLLEIAHSLGRKDEIANWLRSPGYLPESLFYAFIGRPEMIRLRAPRQELRHVRSPGSPIELIADNG
jgi:hypothetical protein